MNNNFIIRKIGAAFLMLIFFFGVTPKKFLHDSITQHQHTKTFVQKCSHHHINIIAAGYNCQLDNLVVDIPFEIVFVPTFLFSDNYYIAHQCKLFEQKISATFYIALLRGPPTC